MCILIVLVIIGTVSGLAQGTWKNLQFGTSPAEVKASLSKQGLSLQRSDEGWEVKPQWNLRVPNVKIPFHFSPYLSFSGTNKLERIELDLQTDRHMAEGVDATLLTEAAAPYIHEQLVGKYGKPVSQVGICDRVSVNELIGGPGRVECKAVWKAAGQTVTLNWTYFERSVGVGELFFSITYLSSQSGGL